MKCNLNTKSCYALSQVKALFITGLKHTHFVITEKTFLLAGTQTQGLSQFFFLFCAYKNHSTFPVRPEANICKYMYTARLVVFAKLE